MVRIEDIIPKNELFKELFQDCYKKATGKTRESFPAHYRKVIITSYEVFLNLPDSDVSKDIILIIKLHEQGLRNRFKMVGIRALAVA